MRAAKRFRIGNRRGPPAFAPVILFGAMLESILIPLVCQMVDVGVWISWEVGKQRSRVVNVSMAGTTLATREENCNRPICVRHGRRLKRRQHNISEVSRLARERRFLRDNLPGHL